jgi:hypothetical protein
LIQVTAASPTAEANVQQLKFKNPVWGRSSYVQTLEQDVLTSFKEFSLAEKARLFEKRKGLFEWRKRIEWNDLINFRQRSGERAEEAENRVGEVGI